MFSRTPERIAAEQRRASEKARAKQQQQEDALHQERQHYRQLAEQQRTSEALERIRDHDVRYANTIILLGYGGFFALWATQASKLPSALLGLAGILMAVSLIIFVAFEVAKIFAVSRAVTRGSKLQLSNAQTVDLANHYLDKVQAWWLPPFLLSALTGFAAGGILLYSFAVMAFGGT